MSRIPTMLLIAAAAGAVAPSAAAPAGSGPIHGPIPTPIGRGPRYAPPARAPVAAACEPGLLEGRFRAHLEIFAGRRVVIVPTAIGLGPPVRTETGRVVSARCRAQVRTLDPTGVVHFDRPGLTVGDVFRVWRTPLSRGRLASFRGSVSAFVGGRRYRGDPRALPLRDGAEIVLEVGGYVPPHRFYVFPPRD